MASQDRSSCTRTTRRGISVTCWLGCIKLLRERMSSWIACSTWIRGNDGWSVRRAILGREGLPEKPLSIPKRWNSKLG